MTDNFPILIPSSIQRVRCFMNTKGRFKAKPWAGTDETLDTFLSLLSSRVNDNVFWKDLQLLLNEIAKDLKYRLSLKERVIDNEVLNSDRYDDLLDEIRKAASLATVEKDSFKSCIGKLSLQAASLLFLMGSVAAIGCVDNNLSDNSGTDVFCDTETCIGTDVNIDTDSNTGSDTEANTDTQSEPEDTSQYRTLEEIVAEVISDTTRQAEILSCIEGLHDSWHDGLEELFQNEEDNVIRNRLNMCLMNEYPVNFCDDPKSAGEYNVDALLNNCAIPVYLGVHFE